MINCDLGMSKLFDIELERLTGQPSYSGAVCGAAAGRGGTFFLETFGCQMNDHDSEKVAGLLLSRGYRQVETPEAASLILYNTCSIREKAATRRVRTAWCRTREVPSAAARATPSSGKCGSLRNSAIPKFSFSGKR